MTRIRRVELHHVRVPLPATFYPSWIPGFPQRENRFDLIRVITDDGVEGWSAGPAMSHERAGIGSVLAPYLIGEDPTDIDAMQQRLREVGYLGARQWWVEPAFWDIKAKLAGKPVYELLGGERRRAVPVYCSTGAVRRPEDRVEEAERRYAEGFRAIKLRVHSFAETDDIAQVERTAEAVGDRMKIGVDVNQGWRVAAISDAPRWDLARAKRFVDACADAGLAWVEEPLPMDDYAAQVALREHSRVPISGGEIHTGGLPELKMMIERGCYDIYQPDAIFTGGIAQTMEVARLCRAHDVLYTPHTWTNGVGFAVNLQLMAASGFADAKELEYPYDPPGWVEEARDGILTAPFLHRRGEVELPTRPGLGFEIDRRALKKWGTRTFVMDRLRMVFFGLKDRGLRGAREIDRARRARRAGKKPDPAR
ncbi:MAG TPA: mandelate racemase/muconate lactonizing enzyme family protein [Sandaracinaceae bacterium LLY-WYZ-13_1]|nr:mandelate racemase/muconate lactonizing enzyme family protein [Sandaracinaceae bacterium LLY-WYZ-13_1]